MSTLEDLDSDQEAHVGLMAGIVYNSTSKEYYEEVDLLKIILLI